jgi:hypothetical protein
MNMDRPLRAALLANAAFSASCAVLLILAPVRIGELLGLSAPAFIFQLVGAGLVLFAIDLVHQATRPRLATWRALYASAADFLWVIGTFLALALFPGALSGSGLATVLAVAVLVAAFGMLQLLAIDRAHRDPASGMHRHCLLVDTHVPADAIWGRLRQLGDIAHYMPTLRRSELLNGHTPSVGAVRRCEDLNGRRWSEECTAFSDADRSFVVRFLTREPGFPFPAKSMTGGWQINATNDHAAQVMVWWELQPKPRLAAPLLLPLLAWQADRDFPRVVARIAEHASGERPRAPAQPEHRPGTRLSARAC